MNQYLLLTYLNTLILTAFLCSPLSFLSYAKAQSVTSKKKSPNSRVIKKAPFVGLVQFVTGSVKWSQRNKYDKTQKIEFKTQLHYGDKIRIKKGGLIKIISSERCIGVVYGPGVLLVPESSTNLLWQVPKGASRWICQSKQELKVKIQVHNLTLKFGEIFSYKQKLLVHASAVTSDQGPLPPMKAYKWSSRKNQWVSHKKTNSSPLALWKLNQKRKIPQESLPIAKPKPPAPVTPAKKAAKKKTNISSRWMMGPTLGGGNLSHSTKDFGIDNMEIDGFRFMFHYQFAKRDWSLLGALTFYDGDKNQGENDDPSFQSIPPAEPSPDESYHRLTEFSAEIGFRKNHSAKTSLFAKIGVGIGELKLDQPLSGSSGTPNSGMDNYLHEEVSHLMARLALGYDWLIWANPNNWWGVYAAVEIFYSQAITKIDRVTTEQNQQTEFTDSQIEDDFSSFGILINFGPLLQF